MTREEIVRGLRCSASCGEPLDCTGCLYLLEDKDEDGVRIQDCNADRIFENAADLLENDRSQILALQRELELKRAQLDCASASAEKLRRQNGELREAAALVTRLAADAAEREWISAAERMPEEHESIFAKAYGTKRWANGMFRTISDEVFACVAFDDGHKTTMTLRTHDGAWALSSIHRGHVTYWMPLPEPPEEGEHG